MRPHQQRFGGGLTAHPHMTGPCVQSQVERSSIITAEPHSPCCRNSEHVCLFDWISSQKAHEYAWHRCQLTKRLAEEQRRMRDGHSTYCNRNTVVIQHKGLQGRVLQTLPVTLTFSAPHEYEVSKAHALAGYYCHLT